MPAAPPIEGTNSTTQFDQGAFWTVTDPRFRDAHTPNNQCNRHYKDACHSFVTKHTFSQNPTFGGLTNSIQYQPNGSGMTGYGDGSVVYEYRNMVQKVVLGAETESYSGGGSSSHQGLHLVLSGGEDKTCRMACGTPGSIAVSNDAGIRKCSDKAQSQLTGMSNGNVIPNVGSLAAQIMHIDGIGGAMLVSGDGPVCVAGAGNACVTSTGGSVNFHAAFGAIAGRGARGIALGAGPLAPFVYMYTEVPGIILQRSSAASFTLVSPATTIIQNKIVQINPGAGAKGIPAPLAGKGSPGPAYAAQQVA